jgi:tartrate dehydratase alpha subunit/fumarate hydratase class I-like protein
MLLRACLCGVLAMTAGPLGAAERLSLKVSPAVSFAPANLVVRATIQADAANRAVEVVAESNDFYRSSEIELDGENAPRTNMFEFRSIPSGTYEVRVTLRGGGGEQLANVRQQVNVIEAGGAK